MPSKKKYKEVSGNIYNLPENISEIRQLPFDINEQVVLSAEKYRTYWPYFDNMVKSNIGESCFRSRMEVLNEDKLQSEMSGPAFKESDWSPPEDRLLSWTTLDEDIISLRWLLVWTSQWICCFFSPLSAFPLSTAFQYVRGCNRIERS